ncbi:MAG: hypothetical protein Q8Q20_05695 [bacterium]|nr:hypothetical protein [bacterium]
MDTIGVSQQSEKSDHWVFEVTVSNGTTTAHTVILDKTFYSELTEENITPEELMKKSFEFLLRREPRESIMKEFKLETITKHFPEFEIEIRGSQ